MEANIMHPYSILHPIGTFPFLIQYMCDPSAKVLLDSKFSSGITATQSFKALIHYT